MTASSEPGRYILKFSDDTVLLSLLTKATSVNTYSAAVENFVAWCDAHKLQINTSKTAEMVIDPRSAGDHGQVTIRLSHHQIEQVGSFKYLEVYIDKDLSWHTQVTKVVVSVVCSGLIDPNKVSPKGDKETLNPNSGTLSL